MYSLTIIFEASAACPFKPVTNLIDFQNQAGFSIYKHKAVYRLLQVETCLVLKTNQVITNNYLTKLFDAN